MGPVPLTPSHVSTVSTRQIQLSGSHFLCHATASARGSSSGPLGTARGDTAVLAATSWRVNGQKW